jgi:hypothetical protein
VLIDIWVEGYASPPFGPDLECGFMGLLPIVVQTMRIPKSAIFSSVCACEMLVPCSSSSSLIALPFRLVPHIYSNRSGTPVRFYPGSDENPTPSTSIIPVLDTTLMYHYRSAVWPRRPAP